MVRALLVILVATLAVLLLAPAIFFDVPPNTIRWVTQSEEGTFGYNVYRGDTRQGPFQRINDLTILGAGTTDIPQHYTFSDASIAQDTVYFYYVESISLSGERSRLTPVYPSPPKSITPW